MTTHKSFKRLVRMRMEKTGESYTAARAMLLAAEEPQTTGGSATANGAALATSDAVIRERTGRGWEEWFDLLDAWGAADLPHKQIAQRLAAELEIHPLAWNAQAIAVSYERARGMRVVGERADGFAAGASRTVAAPVERLFELFTDPALRAAWLPDGELRERTATKPRSARFDWGDDGSRVHVTFVPKGSERSTVAVEHRRLADAEQAERTKTFWRERLSALQAQLARGGA
jgi:hypothetical protein